MPVPNRVREEARAAEDELRRIAEAQQAQPTAPAAPAEPSSEPRSLDDHFSPGEHPNQIAPEPEDQPSSAISAEDFAKLQQQLETLRGLHNQKNTENGELRARIDTLETI